MCPSCFRIDQLNGIGRESTEARSVVVVLRTADDETATRTATTTRMISDPIDIVPEAKNAVRIVANGVRDVIG